MSIRFDEVLPYGRFKTTDGVVWVRHEDFFILGEDTFNANPISRKGRPRWFDELTLVNPDGELPSATVYNIADYHHLRMAA